MNEREEEKAQDEGLLRWRFERHLNALQRQLPASAANGRNESGSHFNDGFIASLPATLAFFQPNIPWKHAGLDIIWFVWLGELFADRQLQRDQILVFWCSEAFVKSVMDAPCALDATQVHERLKDLFASR